MRYLYFLISLCGLLAQDTLAGEMAVIVHPATNVRSVTQEEVANYFLLPGLKWADGAPVRAFDLRNPPSVRSDFYQTISGKTLPNLRIYWARLIFTGQGYPPKELESVTEILMKVSETPGAIAYVPAQYVHSGVRILLIVPDASK